MEIVTQIIIFCAVTAIGAATRALYLPAAILESRVRNNFFSIVIDVLIAILGAAAMMLVCFLFAGEVRIFYALFFIGGMAIMHFILKKFESPSHKISKKVRHLEKK